MPHITLIRGLPGSGKSTLAKRMAPGYGAEVIEADQFFTDPETLEYRYDGLLIGDAHAWCLQRAENFLKEGTNVIVANTFTMYREISPYFDLALTSCHGVLVIECLKDYGNIHNVPEEVLRRMGIRWVSNKYLESRTIETHCKLYYPRKIFFSTYTPE